MYYIGVDVGGTTIKVGIVDRLGKIVAKSHIPTEKIPPEIQIEKVQNQLKVI